MKIETDFHGPAPTTAGGRIGRVLVDLIARMAFRLHREPHNPQVPVEELDAYETLCAEIDVALQSKHRDPEAE